jgi:hypothetical protein
MATTTPNYGWSVPTSSDYVAQGAVAIETLGDSVDSTLFTALGGAYPGLRLVKKQTIGTSVSSVAVTDAFSATYENYKIIVSGGVAASDTIIALQIGAATTNYYTSRIRITYSSTTVSGQVLSNTSNFAFAGYGTTGVLNMDANLFNPFSTKPTTCQTNMIESATGGGIQFAGGFLNNSTSYTGFTILTSAAMTGGTIYVYGYGAS